MRLGALEQDSLLNQLEVNAVGCERAVLPAASSASR